MFLDGNANLSRTSSLDGGFNGLVEMFFDMRILFDRESRVGKIKIKSNVRLLEDLGVFVISFLNDIREAFH